MSTTVPAPTTHMARRCASTVSPPRRATTLSAAGNIGGYSAVGRTGVEQRQIVGTDVAATIGEIVREQVVGAGIGRFG